MEILCPYPWREKINLAAMAFRYNSTALFGCDISILRAVTSCAHSASAFTAFAKYSSALDMFFGASVPK
jgi:hypothetical protein